MMLQQTQVNTVLKRYYDPFLRRFPNLRALREAPFEDVLKMWEGLGYYRRARYMYETAKHTDELPDDIEALKRLPGIGKNTAHAIAAFAFKRPVPVMEANVRRILCRLFALEAPAQKKLWTYAYALVDKQEPFNYNQAMMDIGATVCRAKNPACESCPLSSFCAGRAAPLRYPAPKKRTVSLRRTYALVRFDGTHLILHRNEGDFLHGLWGFKQYEQPPPNAEYTGTVTHTYTHFKLHCDVYVNNDMHEKAGKRIRIEDMKRYTLSAADKKIWETVREARNGKVRNKK
jgi:A/G-specific adenine glycosylase